MSEQDNKVKICKKCNAVNFADTEFCRICGERLPDESFDLNIDNRQNANYNQENSGGNVDNNGGFNNQHGNEPTDPQEGGNRNNNPQNDPQGNNNGNPNADPNNAGPYGQNGGFGGYNAPNGGQYPPQYGNYGRFSQNNGRYGNYPPNVPNMGFVTLTDDTDLGGMTVREAKLFVGQNSAGFISKFYRKSRGAKAGLNWAVLLLGTLMSPIIQSFWFFNRKMYKIGTIVFTIGLCLILAGIPINMISEKNAEPIEKQISVLQTEGAKQYIMQNDSTVDEDSITSTQIKNVIQSRKFYDGLTPEQKIQYSTLSSKYNTLQYAGYIINMIEMVVAIVIAFTADNFYYNFAKKKIGEIKQREHYCDDDIIYTGGTKATVWALLAIALVVLSIVGVLFFGKYLIY